MKPQDRNSDLNLIQGTGAASSVIPWPNRINEEGMYGIAGDFVRLVTPHTEADPNILLLAFLAYAGNTLGRAFYMMTGADRHCGNVYLCIVGATGHGRKGSAISVVETFFRQKNGPKLGHLLHGVSTGEGIIWEIRDQITKREPNKRTSQFEDVIVDEGVPDKRLLLYLSEFHQCISAMRRQDSILSSVFRQAWDRDIISAPSKTSPATATGACLSIVGCITKDELLRQTDAGDAENGTLNRCMFALSRRSKLLPEGGRFFELIESSAWRELQRRFQDNLENDKIAKQFLRDDNAAENWGFDDKPDVGIYNPLSQARAALWGAVTVRGPQQVIRLSLITAAINGAREIRREHQDAAYDMWRYCDESARYIFGSVENPTANNILQALRLAGQEGMSRTQIYRLWNGRKTAEEIEQALAEIARTGIVRMQTETTGGRASEKWFCI